MFSGLPLQLVSDEFTTMPLLVGARKVRLAPAPRTVTFDDPLKEKPAVALLYVPALRKTTPPPALLQLAMAALIWAVVALEVSVVQMFVRLGIPPTTPAPLQLTARLEASTPVHGVEPPVDAGATVKVRVVEPVPALLVALRVTVEEPAAPGVPEINPVDVLTDNPAGNPVAP